MNTLVILLLISTSFLQTIAQEKKKCIFTQKYTVYVANNLPTPESILTTNCGSKNDNLGTHNITRGHNVNWSFCNNVLGNTLFWCHLYWGSNHVSVNVFRSDEREACVNDQCYWEARFDGIYFDGVYPPRASIRRLYLWNQTTM